MAAADLGTLALDVIALYRGVYLRLQARRDRRQRASMQTIGILQHLVLSGPLTVGEAAEHFGRAQSAVSELFDRLEARGLTARIRDQRDRRRTLVWITDEGRDLLRRVDQVLSEERLTAALGRMSTAERAGLERGLRALVRAADELRPAPEPGHETRTKSRTKTTTKAKEKRT